MKTVILQIGGHSASVGKAGSKIDSQVNELQGRMPHLENAVEHIELSAKRSSVKNSIKFLEKESSTTDYVPNLLLVAKSLGCVRMNKILLKAPDLILSYNKIATMTVDGNGALWWGWYGKMRPFKLLDHYRTLIGSKYRHKNIYQRNKSLYGARWEGAENILLDQNSPGEPTTHSNIIFHPKIDEELDSLARWLWE